MEGASPPPVSASDPAALQDLLDRRTAYLEDLKRISRRDEQLVMERMHNLSVSVNSSSTRSSGNNTSAFGGSDTSAVALPSPQPAPSPEVPATVMTVGIPLRTSAPPTQGRTGVVPARKLTFSLPQPPQGLDCSDHAADAARRKPLRSSPKPAPPVPRAGGPFVSKRDRDGSISVYSPSDAPPVPSWLSSSGAKAPPASPVLIRAPPTRRPPRGELAVAASPIERPSATTPDARDSAGARRSGGPSSYSFTPLVAQRALFGGDTPSGVADLAAVTPMTMGPPGVMRRGISFDDELNAAVIGGTSEKDHVGAGNVDASILGRSPADPAVLDTLSVLGAELRTSHGTSSDANDVSRQLLPPTGGSPPQLVCGRPVPAPFASCGPAARPSLLLQDYDDDYRNRENLGPFRGAPRSWSRPPPQQPRQLHR